MKIKKCVLFLIMLFITLNSAFALTKDDLCIPLNFTPVKCDSFWDLLTNNSNEITQVNNITKNITQNNYFYSNFSLDDDEFVDEDELVKSEALLRSEFNSKFKDLIHVFETLSLKYNISAKNIVSGDEKSLAETYTDIYKEKLEIEQTKKLLSELNFDEDDEKVSEDVDYKDYYNAVINPQLDSISNKLNSLNSQPKTAEKPSCQVDEQCSVNQLCKANTCVTDRRSDFEKFLTSTWFLIPNSFLVGIYLLLTIFRPEVIPDFMRIRKVKKEDINGQVPIKYVYVNPEVQTFDPGVNPPKLPKFETRSDKPKEPKKFSSKTETNKEEFP